MLRDLTPRQIVRECAYVIWFLPLWNKDLQSQPAANISNNFVTSESFQDMLGVMQSIILAVKMFGMHFPKVL